jgi:hypothetical protein
MQATWRFYRNKDDTIASQGIDVADGCGQLRAEKARESAVLK